MRERAVRRTQPPSIRPTWPNHTAHRAVHRGGWRETLRELMKKRGGRAFHLLQHRREDGQHLGGAEALREIRLDCADCFHRDYGVADDAVGREDFLHLLPRARDVILLVFLDNAGAEARRDAQPRIAIEVVEPPAARGINPMLIRVILAVDRWRDDRISSAIRYVLHVSWKMQDRLQLREERLRWIDIFRSRDSGWRFERAFQSDDRLRSFRRRDRANVRAFGHAEPGLRSVHVPDADAVVHRSRLEQLDQRLEVFVCAGAEVPVVVNGEIDRRRTCRPSWLLRVDCRKVFVSKPGQPSSFEGWYNERAIGGLQFQLPRADQPTDDLVRIRMIQLVQ